MLSELRKRSDDKPSSDEELEEPHGLLPPPLPRPQQDLPPPPPLLPPPPPAVDLELPPGWQPTWPTALRSSGQVGEAGVTVPPGTAIGSHNTVTNCENGTETSEQISDRSAGFKSAESQGSAVSRLAPEVNADERETAFTAPRTAPNIAHALAQIGEEYLGLNLFGCNSDETKFMGHVLDSIERLHAVNMVLRERLYWGPAANPPVPVPNPPVLTPVLEVKEKKIRIQVLHRIFCKATWHNHNLAIFEDEPEFVSDSNTYNGLGKLKGTQEVQNLERYLQANPDISFVVFKEHSCDDKFYRSLVDLDWFTGPCPCLSCVQRKKQNSGKLCSDRKERISIISSVLKEAIVKFATCRPSADVGPCDSIEMEAPYFFLYHHRKQMADLLENDDKDTREHISLLQEFLTSNYGNEYSEADEQIKNRMVSRKYLNMLFKPNQVVIMEERGTPIARVIHWWPLVDEYCLNVMSWSWEFDGDQFNRTNKRLKLQLGSGSKVPITQLEFYPLEYASPEILQRLINRGWKSWGMRKRYFGCYNGWDAHHDRFYVSHSQVPTWQYKRSLNHADRKQVYD